MPEYITEFHPIPRNFGALPSSGLFTGYPFFDATAHIWKYWNGSTWVDITSSYTLPNASGDVTGALTSNTVATVGGATAANVASAASLKHTQNTDTGTSAATFTTNAIASTSISASTTLCVTGLASFTTAGIALPTGQNVVFSGTWAARPASPYDKQRYFCTDSTDAQHYGLEWFWGGTYWLSSQLFKTDITDRANYAVGVYSGDTLYAQQGQFNELNSVFTVYIVTSFGILTTFNASNYWTLTLAVNNAGVWGTVASYSTWATSRVINLAYQTSYTLNTIYTPTTAGSIAIHIAKSGSPGNIQLYNPTTMWYRRVG